MVMRCSVNTCSVIIDESNLLEFAARAYSRVGPSRRSYEPSCSVELSSRMRSQHISLDKRPFDSIGTKDLFFINNLFNALSY